ncbi:L,D-transpeptidase family protein [Sporomusa malonica]|uniref:Lipoprotein-anchoring transpeptidase ErfK/SrfK n=1 Tax=Sporomusa malonica TaxID=112901 RepID=A0A1W1Z6R1_9FIRM|nr:Lipoprotein-anchoring transpeptidase ErfK/SrfK [Sporomusa malonica]
MRLPMVTINGFRLFSIALLLVLLPIVNLLAEDPLESQPIAAVQTQPSQPPQGEVNIIVKIPERVLELYDSNGLYKKYRIAVGKSDTPTPIGDWKVVWKDYNWGTGFGTRWMGVNVPWGIYGIHGTNKPWSIGKYASHGCIRMRNSDVEQLFEWVPIGTIVRIEGPINKVKRELKHKMSGQDVVLLQRKLKDMGFLSDRADGIFGKATEDAVKKYQEANNLQPTGVVDNGLVNLLQI